MLLENVLVKTHYSLPEGMRYSLLMERRKFYSGNFDVRKLGAWLAKHRDPVKTAFAVVIGRHTGIYLKRFENYIRSPILIDGHKSLADAAKMIAGFLPEGAYYDRNLYSDLGACARCKKRYENCWGCRGFLGQELAFDIDPENIPCSKCGTLKEKLKRRQGLSFCEYELERAKEQAVGLQEELGGKFEEAEAVYSGRGYHVHVFDKRANRMSREERSAIAAEIKNKGYSIDAWITEGTSRLIRLPYSLHGMVSRIVLPVEKEGLPAFNPVREKRCRPKFL